MEYELIDNKLSTKDFIKLWKSADWGTPPAENQIEAGLKNSLFTVAVIYDNQVIGMGRIIGDGFMTCYIQDVIVLPKFQGKGIGKAIMESLITYIRDNALPNTYITAGLFSAKGKEKFYEKFGFYIRPTDNRGAGMMMGINNKV